MLETMRPEGEGHETTGDEDVRAVLGAEGLVYRVWGGDWCGDCQAQLPAFAATLSAAGVPNERIHQYPVEKTDDGSKAGPMVEAYGIDRIPTVVVERDGQEVARFVESTADPIAVVLARQLR